MPSHGSADATASYVSFISLLSSENPQGKFGILINMSINYLILTKELITCYKNNLAGVKFLTRGKV